MHEAQSKILNSSGLSSSSKKDPRTCKLEQRSEKQQGEEDAIAPAFVTPLKLRIRRQVNPCLVIHAVAGRTFPAGERGSAAGSLLSSHYPDYTRACVLCRPSPELRFHFVWFLGWSIITLAGIS
jgi:hypothetical protein